jgi:hypothetical protein
VTRPYVKHRIQDLEALFAANRADREVLSLLLTELAHRTTGRAAKLRVTVKGQIAALGETAPLRAETGRPAASVQAQAALPTAPVARGPEVAPPGVQPSQAYSQDYRTQKRGQSRSGISVEDADAVLGAWTALEVLSPPLFVRPEDLAGGDGSAVIKLDDRPLPWERGEKSRPGFRLYYQVVLGSVPMEPAIDRLLSKYADDRPERPLARGEAALAVVVVDQSGRPVEYPAVAVSSFAWGVVVALSGRLSDLAAWSTKERELSKFLEDELLGPEEEPSADQARRDSPLTKSRIQAAHEAVVRKLRLPPDLVRPPEFVIRSYVYYKDPNPPDPVLLNSFILGDLAQARGLIVGDQAPDTLKRYLGIAAPSWTRDLLRETAALEEAAAPGITPLARWPSPGKRSLVLLQQAAVNIAATTTDSSSILGVNGPPGTGKTTLLRDMVAGVLMQRAAAMVEIADPESAFTHTNQKLRAGAGWLHLYSIADSLRGFEMLVASTNNRAVENVSAELPSAEAVCAELAPRYFKTVSDAVHGRDTWGLIAAVLGNAQNRSRFRNAFWWDKDAGMFAYLGEATGVRQEIQEKDPETGELRRRPPKVVVNEHPPRSREEALDRWRDAVSRFRRAKVAAGKWQKWLEHVRQAVATLPSLGSDADRLDSASSVAFRAAVMAEADLDRARSSVEAQKASQLEAVAAHREHQRQKPDLVARLFGSGQAEEWRVKDAALAEAVGTVSRALVDSKDRFTAAERMARTACEARDRAVASADTSRAAVTEARRAIQEARERFGVTVADSEFFRRPHEEKHRASPWCPDAAQAARDEMFVAAVEVHRAFVDAAAKPLKHNLGALMSAFNGAAFAEGPKQALLQHLWASLFLVVPVVSTTFASVERMLGRLPPRSLGWLFIDEAGQALPQAAVGALFRCQRAVVLGDPAQLEPIVQLPATLSGAICEQMGVDGSRFVAPEASVQSLADSASSYESEFQTESGTRTVGVPLLVHRRCMEPMFSVSNEIAYAGLMVHAREPRASSIRDALGSSRWIEIDGHSQDKWCAAEGDIALQLLRRLAARRIAPDLYVISPFRIVVDRLRKTVRESGILNGWVDADPFLWTGEKIGTVHTAQGREAEAVIMVLGAPSPSQTGARNWAGGRPNLLNVAVTRAKEALYVIGSRRLWQTAGVFAHLAKRLPAEAAHPWAERAGGNMSLFDPPN